MRSALFFGVCWAAAGAATASADDASCGEADDEVCAMRSSLLQLRRREFSSSETGLAGANGTNDTNGTNGTNGTEENASAACLCVFDIDRTLTGKQQQTKMCPGNKVMWGVNDWAYTNHAMSLTLSDAVQHLNQTFCAKCYIGIVSAGTASGSHSEERSILLDLLKNDLPWSKPWADPWNPGSCKDITAPLVTGCPDGHKQEAIPSVIRLYENAFGVSILKEDVFMFDDRSSNIQGFEGTGYNARQISCATRDAQGSLGLCGATVSEIVNTNSGHLITCCSGSPKGTLRQKSAKVWAYTCD
eukprot:TRINITY_DN12694_c0_g1_i1.p1 TRINITY_DN12694_c0_g1~~TRINITY_DN12694_c0_g1_i1.p1  ORF type:complete len:301 (+),score=61.02 TRINITY_DN12694_c0_g1_i1:71-973(+)